MQIDPTQIDLTQIDLTQIDLKQSTVIGQRQIKQNSTIEPHKTNRNLNQIDQRFDQGMHAYPADICLITLKPTGWYPTSI